MTAAEKYDQLRIELLLRQEDFSEEEELAFAEQMEVVWQQMTSEEQQAVEDSLAQPPSLE